MTETGAISALLRCVANIAASSSRIAQAVEDPPPAQRSA